MKITLMILCAIIGTCLSVSATNESITGEQREGENDDFDYLSKSEDDDNESSKVPKKRESGYSYRKPTRLPVNYRPSQAARLGYRRRPHSRRPGQQIRPFTQYGLPMKNRSMAPAMQQGFVPSVGINSQGVPSPVRNMNFEEANPIASQNDVPFGRNTALYLPPRNQPLPEYTAPSAFSFGSHQSLIQDNSNGQQISDAALFLAQNAQAISDLYGAPAPNQVYAPSSNDEDLFDQNNQIQQQQSDAENASESNSPAQVSHDFTGPLPAYASGILNSQEALEKIRSLEKDRLILELRKALLQSQNAETGRYSQTVLYPQEHGGGGGGGGLGAVFGTAESPRYTFSYGLSTSPTAPSSTTPVQPSPSIPALPSDGTGSTGPSLTPTQYPGLLPTVITGTNILSNIPNYNPGLVGLGGGQSVPIKPADAPTHFGIPFPGRPGLPGQPVQKPSVLPDLTGVSHVTPVIPARPTSPSVPAPPVHPISAPIQPVRPVYPITTPLRPVVPVNPVTPIQPVVTPIIDHQGHGLGIQPQSPLVYKHLKAVYPFYYPGQKAVSPVVQPWLYPQKPIWN